MDAVTGFWAQLVARTGLAGNPEAALVAGLAVTVLVVVIALALGRRSSRLEQRFADPAILPSNAGDAEAPGIAPPDSDPSRLPAVDPATHSLGDSTRPTSDSAGDRLDTDVANLRDGMALVLPATEAEFMAVQQSVQNYQERIELLRTTLNSLQSEQLTLHKLLEACNVDLANIERFTASLPNLRNEHASIQRQLAELNARFRAVSEVLADFLPPDEG